MSPAQQSLIDAAKATAIAYNNKDWTAARNAMTPDFVYDEVATHRKVQGPDDVLAVWKGWATAMPDSKCEFHAAHASGNTVALELTWRGTHTGPMQTPAGEIPATGKSFELRAVQVVELAGDKTKSMRQYFDMATLFQQLGISS
ncbi:MAG: ester cyclase [Acidimicrobiia bacterium]|nr:ester cyclase [Acidimicrobiia bacterium]